MFWEQPVIDGYRQILNEHVPAGYEMVYYNDLDDAGKAEACQEVEFYLLNAAKAPTDRILSTPRLRHIQRTGIGYETIDVHTCDEKGITVSNLPLGNATAVAEHCMLLTLAALRKLIPTDRLMRQGVWPFWEYRTSCYELDGKVHGFIGMGNIARLTAQRSRPFGTELIYYDIVRLSEDRERALGLTYCSSMEEVLRRADIVSIHLHLNESTRNIIGAKEIAMMKPGSFLVNISRGGLVDEDALYKALVSGHLAGAGIDTWATEPNVKDSPLLTLDTVVATGHTASGTIDTFRKQAIACFDNIVKADREGYPDFCVGENKHTRS